MPEDSFYLLKIGIELSPPTGCRLTQKTLKRKQCDGAEDAKCRIIIDHRTQHLTTTPKLKLEDGVCNAPKEVIFLVIELRSQRKHLSVKHTNQSLDFFKVQNCI